MQALNYYAAVTIWKCGVRLPALMPAQPSSISQLYTVVPFASMHRCGLTIVTTRGIKAAEQKHPSKPLL